MTNVDRREYTKGFVTQDDVVTTCRFILVLRGEVEYTVEGKTTPFGPGAQLFVPAWVRRVWTVPRRAPLEIIWCEFDDDPLGLDRTGCFFRQLKNTSLEQEKRRYLELARTFKRYQENNRSAVDLLCLEGALKAMLAGFWREATASPTQAFQNAKTTTQSYNLHDSVKQALRWLDLHFTEAGVLEALYQQCPVTPNYLRRQFKVGMQCSPNEYVQRLRLRHARHLLNATDWQLKRIAVEVGYNDPLYFSRLYHRFWGRSPREDREALHHSSRS